ncbi:hypothetical protein OAB01_02275 [Bacteroidia bacterium]|nr:hypothetical protein [Bacteroidia bacterium]
MKKILLPSILAVWMLVLGFTGIKQMLLDTKVKAVYSDRLNQIYTVGKDNSIHKFDNNGKLVISRNLKIQGDIAHIDAKNVFDMLLFYKNINTLVTTDNLFNQRHTLNFNDNRYLSNKQVTAVARSFDNHIWAFDMVSQRLMKIDILGNLILESSALPTQSSTHQIQQIIENVPYVYLVDSTSIVTMNVYGKMIKELNSNQPINQAQLFKDTLWLESESHRMFLNTKKTTDSIQMLDQKPANTSFQYLGNGKLELRNDSLFLHQEK